jgi:hypothetical protein
LEKWKNFVLALIDPWVILILAATIYLSVVLVGQEDGEVVAIFTAILSITSGILGGLLGKKWDDLTTETVIEARGKSAVRDLKILLRSIATLESSVHEYLEEFNAIVEDDQQPKLTEIYLREIIRDCNSIEEQVINATESWIDVVPEMADIHTQIGMITDLKEKYSSLEEDYESVNIELEAIRNESDEEVAALKSEKRKIERELQETRTELRRKVRGSGLTFASDMGVAGDINRISGDVGRVRGSQIVIDASGELRELSLSDEGNVTVE